MRKGLVKNGSMILLCCIIFYVGILLFYNLGLQSFWIDEAYSSYVAKYMSLNGLYKSSYFLFEWLQVLCFKLWGITDFWARFPSVIIQLGSVLLMYYIPKKLCNNGYVGLFSALIFGLLYWEIGRGRDARFYSLLQLMLLLEIFLMIKWVDTKKTLYLNFGIVLSGLGVVFHPFLYCLLAILSGVFLCQYKKLWDLKSIFSKKYYSTWILLLILGVAAIIYGTLGGVLKGSLDNGLSRDAKKYYFSFYTKHLWEEIGMILVFGFLGMLRFIIKKKRMEVSLIFLPFVLFVYALVIKGYLMHSRYALLIYPLMILSSTMFIFDILKYVKSKKLRIFTMIFVLLLVGFTAHFQFVPLSYYYFDYTSPQPDFKSAYAAIPNGSKVISGFPTLCDWYYSDRGECTHAIRVDLVHDGKSKVVSLTGEKYTGLPYVDDLDQLVSGVYYFVLDNLTRNSDNINYLLFKQIINSGKKLYESGNSYNSIFVVQVVVNG